MSNGQTGESAAASGKLILRAVVYLVPSVILILTLYWVVTRILITNSQLEVTCLFDCLSRCARADLPSGGRPIEGLPSRLEPGGPSCGEICESRCGNRAVLSPTTQIFFDDFEADTVGSPPATLPAGAPSDDRLALGGAAGSLTVVSAAAPLSKACRVARGSTPAATILDMIAGGGGPHAAGRYSIRWRGYVEDSDAQLRITLLSSSAKQGFELQLRDTSIRLVSGAGTETLSATFADGVAHSFEIEVDLDANRVRIAMNGTVIATDKPLIDNQFEDLHMLRLQYVGATVEALEGTYVIDDAVMERE